MQTSAQASPSLVVIVSTREFAAPEWHRRHLRAIRLQGDAMERMLSDSPEAIVLDLEHSSRHEQQICWELCELFGLSLVVLAEGASTDAVVQLLERGAADVLTDRAEPLLLAARVAAILRRRPPASLPRIHSVIALGGVQVDLVRRMVLRPDGARSLSRTEFSLLLALLRAEGRACSHRELISQVWGASQASSAHYLRLYVRYLRDKLEDDPRNPRVIVNVWGRGYRLNSDTSQPSAFDDAASVDAPSVKPATTLREGSWLLGCSSLPLAQQISGGSRRSLKTASS